MLHTALHDWHATHGGRMVDFAGWHMPVQYTSIVAEHQAVRTACGLFDIAHMGRLKFTGADAVRFLDHIVTNDVAGLSVGQIRYALVTNEQGGILDDVLVYRFADFHLLVVNASNRGKILAWIELQRGGFEVNVEDLTRSHFMLALQGPRAIALIQPLVDLQIGDLAYYTGAPANIDGVAGLVSRTGYTGEDGCEVIVPVSAAFGLWKKLVERGAAVGLLPAGLGCRDTLRLEAAMPLYGHELSESIDPYTAGLAFGVKLDAKDFIGKPAVTAAKANANRPRRVGIELTGKRIAREGAEVFAEDAKVGAITSGTFSPTLQKSICMGYVAPEFSASGTTLTVDIRGTLEPATVVKLPFYKRPA